MIPIPRHRTIPGAGIPRESGDDPFLEVFIEFIQQYSPRERG